MTIGTLAHKEIEDFKRTTVMLTDGDSFNQYNNLRRINLYKKGKFWDCPDPNAIFWNVGTPRVPLYAKSVDMNTKDFLMIGIGKFNWFKAFIANARFKQWAKDEQLAITLDDTSTGIADYGSMVWKKSYDNKGKVEMEEALLSNLYFDQTVKNIIDSPVVETHYMTATEIRSRYPEQASEIIEKAKIARDEEDNDAESEDEKYQILERWGEFKGENDKKEKYYHWVGSGQGDSEVEIVMDEIKIGDDGKPKEFAYFDFHGERVKGRWQGLGVIERLFNQQEQANKLVNQNDEANDINNLLLFRTADGETTGNILDAVRPGQIINSQDIQQIAINGKTADFLNQLQNIERKCDELCFITESISGDTPPSGTPFRSLAVATRASKSTFRYIKTSIGEKMGWVLQDHIMPDVVKGFNKEDLFDIMESNADIRLYDEMKIDDGIKKFMKMKAKEGKTVVFQQDIDKEVARIQKELERGGRQEKVVIDFTWGIRMNPTGESVDKNTMNAAIDSGIQDMSANPAIVNTPIYQQKLENHGIPPFRLRPEEIQAIQQSQGTKLPPEPTVDKLSALAEE